MNSGRETGHPGPRKQRSTVETPAGSISYLDEGSGPTLVFLHGTLANANTWRKLTPLLSSHYRCIQPDLPLGAHHLPLAEGVDLTPPGIADIVEAFLNALDLHDLVLVGNDTGGAYAQVYAATHPSRLRGLVLTNTDCLDVFPPEQFQAMPRLIGLPGYTTGMAALFRIKSFAAGPSVLGKLSKRLTPDEIRSEYLHNFITLPGIRSNLASAAKGWSTSHTQRAATSLANQRLPTLICWGRDDELFPLELGRRLAEIMAHATFVAVEESSTYVQEDHPEDLAREIDRFVSSIVDEPEQ